MGLTADLLILIRDLVKIFFITITRWMVPASYKSVEGDVCLITGSGSGIGRVMALEFAKRKAKLVLWDINEEGLRETEKSVHELGAEVFADVCDVSNRERIKESAEKAREKFGDITILINNAGITYCKELLDLSDRQIEQTFKVNTLAVMWTLREFLPRMMETNYGHIVTIASTVGLFSSPGMPDYCASKHAAVGLHQAIYFDLQNTGRTGVKTTLVCPYLMTTGMFNGVNVKRTFLLPPLSAKESTRRIMHGVLTDRPFVAIPRLMYIFYCLTTILPMRALYSLYVFIGADQAIGKFRPNRSYQKNEC